MPKKQTFFSDKRSRLRDKTRKPPRNAPTPRSTPPAERRPILSPLAGSPRAEPIKPQPAAQEAAVTGSSASLTKLECQMVKLVP